MPLSSSFYSGITGLNVLGNSMQIIGDNIANVNTIGYKSNRASFQDLLSQTISTSGGSAQIGQGTDLGSVMSNFEQSSFERIYDRAERQEKAMAMQNRMKAARRRTNGEHSSLRSQLE